MTPAKEKPAHQPKKPYKKPVLRHYGTIRTLTENIGAHGANDGGTNPKVRTRV